MAKTAENDKDDTRLTEEAGLDVYLERLDDFIASMSVPSTPSVSSAKVADLSAPQTVKTLVVSPVANKAPKAPRSSAGINIDALYQLLVQLLPSTFLPNKWLKTLLFSPASKQLICSLLKSSPMYLSRLLSASCHALYVVGSCYVVLTQAHTLIIGWSVDTEKIVNTKFSAARQVVASDQATLQGVDVSHYQGLVDWHTVKDNNISFAYIKATEGDNYIDPSYHLNLEGVKTAKLLHGAYHFYMPADDARQQAMFFVRQIQNIAGKLPPVLDIEITQNIDKPALVAGLKVWLSTVEKYTGCRPIIYTYFSFWQEYLEGEFDEYALWLADYESAKQLTSSVSHSTSPAMPQWMFLQYTDEGGVKGIKGKVDRDHFQGDLYGLHSKTCKKVAPVQSAGVVNNV